jgi:hypothetical protein
MSDLGREINLPSWQRTARRPEASQSAAGPRKTIEHTGAECASQGFAQPTGTEYARISAGKEFAEDKKTIYWRE